MSQTFTKLEELVKERIDQQISALQDQLGRGQVHPDTLAKDYWQLVGKIAGLRDATAILATTLKDLEHGINDKPTHTSGSSSHNPYS